MVCITGQVGKHLLDLMPFGNRYYWISTPVTKWNYQITEASEIPEIMAKAFTLHDQDVQAPF
jgi:acetolactate synthase-1/2/3 large subunit